MTLRHTQRAAVHGQRFTLVELLTVMVIMAILLAVTVPVIIKVTSGSSVEAASRMVGAQLRLARQEAITKRKYVAVLFPAATGAGVPDEARYHGFRACYVDSANVWTGWVLNAPWSYVPVGAVIAEVDGDDEVQWDASSPQQPIDNVFTTVTGIDSITTNASRAVVFRPSGRVGSQFAVSLVEGAVLNDGGVSKVQAKNKLNWIDVRANQYTGRVTFFRPGV